MAQEQLTLDLAEIPVQFDTNNLVTKSNLLIESSYKLSTLESKLILTLFSNVQPSDEDINTYVFQIQPFVEMLDLKGKSKYKDLREITKGLMQKVYEIRIGDTLHQVSWLSHVAYNTGEGTISMRFDEFWKPYILQLQQNFTSYKLGNITKLKSSYSIRLYELLKQWQKVGKHVFALKDLRSLLGVPDDTYKLYANFKQRILLNAQKELKKASDIVFEFKEIKEGRSVTKIQFNISYNQNFPKIDKRIPKTPLKKEIPFDQQDLREELEKLGVSDKIIIYLLDNYEKKRIKANIKYTKSRMELGSVKKPAGYVKRAVEQNFADSRGNGNTLKKKEKINNLPREQKKEVEEGLDVEMFLSYLDKKKEVLIKLGESKKEIKEQIQHDLDDIELKEEYEKISTADKMKLKNYIKKFS
ncbi:replication initiation protein [Rummeliibacillus stabekisii]|uniref:replication initiation protein n=1 Tax=Rummeliibacillus stabekisii TaxID=241244 RepID=UPI001168C2DA|nr:replication initiation protein [Rummeliibacillus stabekisii]MBB5171552.1 hypothetical protein [Rummeliibacillus stabekisii]GEL05520.1 hypothetical protein RST01_21470 [Rummeliibacillus stabekisii]